MTLLVAFLAGLISCVSPCVLPVVPVFAGYVAGGSGRGWSADPVGAASKPAGSATWRAIGFLLGFLGLFVVIWASVGLVGYGLMATIPVLRQVVGAALVLMGIGMIAGRHPMLTVPGRLVMAGRSGPVLLGAGVAIGWTPCIGPTLGAILALAASSTTAGGGALLLTAYAAGLAVPFLAVLATVQWFRGATGWLARRRRLIDLVTGLLVLTVGILVYTGAFARLAGLFAIGAV